MGRNWAPRTAKPRAGVGERRAAPQAREDLQALVEQVGAAARVHLLAERRELVPRPAARPTPSTNRPPESTSSATVSRATFHGRRRDSGVTIIPSRTRSVRAAIAASAIHGSVAGIAASSSRAM